MENPTELYHHGVKGQKWGVRRSKAQLGYSTTRKQVKRPSKKDSKKNRKQLEERRRLAKEKEANVKRREKILSSPTKLYKHRNEFTKQEIDDAMKRFEWERRLSSYSADEFNAGKRYVDSLLGYADTGIRTYNTIAKVYNTISPDRKLRTIGEKGDDKKKKKKNDADEDD